MQQDGLDRQGHQGNARKQGGCRGGICRVNVEDHSDSSSLRNKIRLVCGWTKNFKAHGKGTADRLTPYGIVIVPVSWNRFEADSNWANISSNAHYRQSQA